MTTRPHIFRGSLRDSTGLGPDFPGSAGDREQGKFRESATPRLDQVAVSGDGGRPVIETTDQFLAEILVYQKAILIALARLSEGEEFTPEEVLGEVE